MGLGWTGYSCPVDASFSGRLACISHSSPPQHPNQKRYPRRVLMDVKMNYWPDVVKAALGYRDGQWHRFYVGNCHSGCVAIAPSNEQHQWVTREEARGLIAAHPECLTYASFSTTERINFLDCLNDKWAADGILTINTNTLKWRMTGKIRRKLGTCMACLRLWQWQKNHRSHSTLPRRSKRLTIPYETLDTRRR